MSAKTSTKQKNELIEFDQYMHNIEEDSVHRKIIYVEYLSIVLTLSCLVLTTFLAIDDNSITAFAIAVDSFLDVLAYMVCIWRYRKSNVSKNNKENNGYKDQVASITLSVLFLSSAFLIEMLSVKSYLAQEKPVRSYIFIAIAVFQSLIFSVLAIVKFLLAQKLTNSKVIVSDGINSLICSLSNLSMAASMLLYIAFDIWYFDSIFGFIIGLMVFAYGTQLLMNNCCFKDL